MSLEGTDFYTRPRCQGLAVKYPPELTCHECTCTCSVELAAIRGRLAAIRGRLDQILNLLNNQQKELLKMALDFSKLTAAVTAEQTVEGGVKTLLESLNKQLGTVSAELAAALAANDPTAAAAAQAQIDALTAQIAQNSSALQAAITANTPAATATT